MRASMKEANVMITKEIFVSTQTLKRELGMLQREKLKEKLMIEHRLDQIKKSKLIEKQDVMKQRNAEMELQLD